MAVAYGNLPPQAACPADMTKRAPGKGVAAGQMSELMRLAKRQGGNDPNQSRALAVTIQFNNPVQHPGRLQSLP